MVCVAGVGTGCPYLNRLMFFSLTRMSSTMGYTLLLIRSRTHPIPASSRQCLSCKYSSQHQQWYPRYLPLWVSGCARELQKLASVRL